MKTPLVLLHGWGVNSLIWQPILPQLESDFDLTVVDLPGYGNDIDYFEEYSLDAIANEVLARAPDQAIWVGWSLGGTVAIAAALARPERFLKLQLVSTTPRFLNGPDWDLGVGLRPYESMADRFDDDYQSAVHQFLLLQILSKDRARFMKSRRMIRELAQTLNQHKPPISRTLRAGLKILSDTDLRPRLSDLTVETQMIAGGNDHIVPAAASEYLFGQLNNGHSFHVFKAGHLPFLEAQSKYIEALSNFANPA